MSNKNLAAAVTLAQQSKATQSHSRILQEGGTAETGSSAPHATLIAAATNVAVSLIQSGFDVTTTAQALIAPTVYPELTARDLATVLLDSRVAPQLKRDQLSAALSATNHYSADDVTAAVNAFFPAGPMPVIANNAFQFTGGVYMSADSNGAYQFGTDDFTIEAMLKSTSSGTLVGRKSTEGMAGNGGFLLVVKSDGTIKFATDNGYGFFEVNAPSRVLDGQWHHVAAVRKGTSIQIYVDGNPAPGSPRGNATPPLNVNNSMRLTIGTVDQQQEPFRAFTGLLAEVRMWRKALSQDDIQRMMGVRLAWNTDGLIGYWTGEFGQQVDVSVTRNATYAQGNVGVAGDGPPAFAHVTAASPYCGAYDNRTKPADASGSWQNDSPLYLFSNGLVVFQNRLILGATITATTVAWTSEAGNTTAASVTFRPSSSDMRYWPQGPQHTPLFEGWLRDSGAGRTFDFCGLRRS